MSTISKSKEGKRAQVAGKHSESSVERSYYNKETGVKNKRLSASPDYHNAYKGGFGGSVNNSTRNEPYNKSPDKWKQEKGETKKVNKRRSLNVVHTSVKRVLQKNSQTRSVSKKRGGFHNISSSPPRYEHFLFQQL